MILVVIPPHLRTLAGVRGDVQLEVDGEVTRRSVLDALPPTGGHSAAPGNRIRSRAVLYHWRNRRRLSTSDCTTGKSHSFGGEYLELTPHERIRHTDRFDDPNLPGEMQTTITLKQVSCGTELNIVQEGVPGVIPVEACYLGWQESLTLLGELVEAEIPDQT